MRAYFRGKAKNYNILKFKISSPLIRVYRCKSVAKMKPQQLARRYQNNTQTYTIR